MQKNAVPNPDEQYILVHTYNIIMVPVHILRRLELKIFLIVYMVHTEVCCVKRIFLFFLLLKTLELSINSAILITKLGLCR